jgi:hypothetical protein
MNGENKNQDMLINQVANSLSNNSMGDMTRVVAMAGAAIAGGALYYYLNSTKPRPCTGIDYANQTREIENRTDGARMNVLIKEDNKLLAYYYEDVRTLYDLFKKGEQLSSKI